MANRYWTGLAAAVAQVDTFTPGGTIEIGDIFTLTITGIDGSVESISFAATAATAANVAAGLIALWNAKTAVTGPLMFAITASGTATVILTAKTAGDAFSVVGTTTEANGDPADDQTFTRAATVANAGPKDLSSAGNFDGDTVPTTGDDVWIEDAEILYGTGAAWLADTLVSFNILRSQLGSNPAAGRAVIYFPIKATIKNIGLNTGMGSATEVAPINIDSSTVESTVYIWNTGSNGTSPAVRIKANCVTTDIVFKAGALGLAYESGETASIRKLTVEGGTLYAGLGLTFITLDVKGGTAVIRSALTTINQSAGKLTTYGSGAVATANISGGTFESNSTGTITALNLTGEGIADFTKSRAPRTVSTLKLDPGATLKYNIDVLTLTNKIQPVLTAGEIAYTAE